MTTIRIFQLGNEDFAMMQIEFITGKDVSINATYYQMMYEYTEENKEDKSNMELLTEIWRKFNADDRPDGHRMRSLSISDVVQIDNKSYICNTMGWKEIEFVGREIVKIK